MRKARLIFAILLALAGGTACRRRTPPPQAAPVPVRFTLAAVGDLLLHQDVQRAAETAGGFHPLWAPVAERLAQADLAFGNLEVPLAPRTGAASRPFVFNAPARLAPDLKTSGFQVLATANNHAYDQGTAGMLETLDHLAQSGLAAVGSGPSREAAEAPLLLERRGLRIAFFARTETLNQGGNGAPTGPWVALLDLERTGAAITAVRPSVDLVVVSLHWGDEYALAPAPRQMKAAEALVAAGADLILGHHPHVLQPLRWVEAGGRKGAVAFSLGNFISNQDRTYRPGQDEAALGDNRDGALLWATFRKGPGRSAALESVDLVPLWTLNNWPDRAAGRTPARDIRVSPLDQVAEVNAIRRHRLETVLEGRWSLR